MSRAPRTTKKQKAFIISFLQENKMLGGKINPLELPKLNKLWENLATKANELGPPKTIKQWKETIGEMKTTVKRRAREIKYGHTGTGGGAGVKPLSDLDELLMSLLSNLTVDGADLGEAGGINVEEQVPSCSRWKDSCATEMEGTPLLQVPNENKEIAAGSVYSSSETKSNKVQRPQKKARTRPPLKINKNRVEMALAAHDNNLDNLTKSNYALAASIGSLAKAIQNLSKRK